ncbi:MAG: AmmeMemoRadiSam system protein B [Candidatus Shapirobacteria bacterium]
MTTTLSLVRKPAVAGSFYPANREELDRQITALIRQADKFPIEGKVRILIVPHAGIVFSGRTAAAGFKQVEGQDYSRVILLGVSHRIGFDHAAVYDQGVWETPLGKVAVDEKLAKAILAKDKQIRGDINAHQEEHSLEMELIFLQKVLKKFKVVPILLSQTSDQLADDLAQRIARNWDDRTLLVVSSDLSHYLSWREAKEKDEETIKIILKKKGQGLTAGAACGREAVKVALKVGQFLAIDFQEIKSENSGDVSGDKSRVVGYAAIGGWDKKVSFREEALLLARKTLVEYLKYGRIPAIAPQNAELLQFQGAFVTLRKKGELRGCLGEFEPRKPLYWVIQEMAIAAATRDRRFLPVTARELGELKIEISVMTAKKKIGDWRKIQLGKHGVVVQKGYRSGTFLPQVAEETGWGLEEFLGQLCSQKAGLAKDCYKDPAISLEVFEVKIFGEV